MAATDSFIHLCFTNKCPTTIHSHRTKVKIDIEYKEADSSADIPMINQRRSPDLFDSRRSVQQKTYNEVSLMPIRSLLIRICFVSVFPIIIYIQRLERDVRRQVAVPSLLYSLHYFALDMEKGKWEMKCFHLRHV